MSEWIEKEVVILGAGSIFRAAFPLMLDYFKFTANKVRVFSGNSGDRKFVESYEAEYKYFELTPENVEIFLKKNVRKSSLLINLTVNVSPEKLIEYSLLNNVLYIDTSLEGWGGEAYDSHEDVDLALDRHDLATKKKEFSNGSTALTCHGANPGLITHFTKAAIMELAKSIKGNDVALPTNQPDWAALCREMNIEVILLSENDTQKELGSIEEMELASTWSIDGMIEESYFKAQFALGTHEESCVYFPIFEHENSSVYTLMDDYSLDVACMSFTPDGEIFSGILMPHIETFSLAKYFSVEESNLDYQPTVLYAYSPCDAAWSSVTKIRDVKLKKEHSSLKYSDYNTRIILDEIQAGVDSLGVILLTNDSNEFHWFGSEVSIDYARQFPHNNATTLQVVAGLISGISYLINNPSEGLLEPEDLPYKEILKLSRPLLGDLYYKKGNIPRNFLGRRTASSWQAKDLISINI